MTAGSLPLPMPLESAAGGSRLRRRRRFVLPVAAVVTAALVALAGYAVGSDRSVVHVTTGSAHASVLQISATADGWSYDIPLDVRWRAGDADGGWHEGSRPACLPPGGVDVPVTFGWVPVHAGDVGWRTVVWVDCR